MISILTQFLVRKLQHQLTVFQVHQFFFILDHEGDYQLIDAGEAFFDELVDEEVHGFEGDETAAE